MDTITQTTKRRIDPEGPYPDVTTQCPKCGANEARHPWPGFGAKTRNGWDLVLCHACCQYSDLETVAEYLPHVWPAVPRYAGAGIVFVELYAPIREIMANTDKDIATVPEFLKRAETFATQGDPKLESWLHSNLEKLQDSLEPRAFLRGWIDSDGFLEIDEEPNTQGDFMYTWRNTLTDWCRSVDAEISAGGK